MENSKIKELNQQKITDEEIRNKPVESIVASNLTHEQRLKIQSPEIYEQLMSTKG